jgi:ribosomal protein L44E
MTQHYTLRTVSAAHYCGKCGKTTQHRIDKGRKGPCLSCIARLNRDKLERELAVIDLDELRRKLRTEPEQALLF